MDQIDRRFAKARRTVADLLDLKIVRRMTVRDFESFVVWAEGSRFKNMEECLAHWLLLKRPSVSMN